MTFRIGDKAFICGEQDDVCELCDKVAETRPYGPGGKRVCFECGMKDEETAVKMFRKVLLGEGDVQ